ncbi:MAG: heavy-metal-associated domain-containing protein [Treponema sp.]|jgi:hypothetical protein|nr:heavy-metal-associated domain-containing protein [Treponema sp.]
MIVSFIPGRVRLRLQELKNETLAARVLARIQEVPGITGAEIKTLTGSLLVEYKTELLSTEQLIALGKAALEENGIPWEP